jgi:hypothetical protein
MVYSSYFRIYSHMLVVLVSTVLLVLLVIRRNFARALCGPLLMARGFLL